jgi:hypothetical protein
MSTFTENPGKFIKAILYSEAVFKQVRAATNRPAGEAIKKKTKKPAIFLDRTLVLYIKQISDSLGFWGGNEPGSFFGPLCFNHKTIWAFRCGGNG